MATIDFTETLATLRPLQQQFILRQIGDQALLYPVVSNVAALSEYVTLNELGLSLWQQLIVEEKTPEEVFAGILAEYDCSQEELHADSDAFFKELSAFMHQQH